TADGVLVDGALGAVLAVVASPNERTPEWLHPAPEKRPTGMVLETNERSRLVIQMRLDKHVANVSPRAGHAADVEQAGARQLLAVDGRVAPAQELVPAADRQERCPILHGLAHRFALL